MVGGRLVLKSDVKPKYLAPDTRAGGGAPEMEVDYPPSQPVGSRFEPHWRPLPAKLPSFGRYSLETLPYLTLPKGMSSCYN